MKRRNALINTSLAAGYLTAMSATAASPRKKIRIGIAGGRFGSMFQWHEHPDCIVEAVTDLIPERRESLMKRYGCGKSYPSLEEMVKDPNLDAIAIFTPAPDHFKHAMLVLNHGKHVISAVPAVMAPSVSEGLDQAHKLLEKVKSTGLTYMMAETSFWQQHTISVRDMYNKGMLGDIICCESDYFHPGLKNLYGTAENPTWRYGVPPMFYPTHSTAHLICLTGERLTEVSCNGWGNDDPICKKNVFNNPFWNETASFRTNKGTPFRVRVWWEAPVRGGEVASWYGDKMSVDAAGDMFSYVNAKDKDDAGFVRQKIKRTKMEQINWWDTDMLPEPMRVETKAHGGSHPFITHEFIDALVNNRRPAVDIHEALAYTVPGIIAHQSALKGGESLKIPQLG